MLLPEWVVWIRIVSIYSAMICSLVGVLWGMTLLAERDHNGWWGIIGALISCWSWSKMEEWEHK